MRRFLLVTGAGYAALLLILFAVPRLQNDKEPQASSTKADSVRSQMNESKRVKGVERGTRAAAGHNQERQTEPKSLRTLYRNGQVSSVWIFRDARLSGESIVYHENGNLWMKIPFEKGREQGVVKIYDEAGTLSASLPYSSGVLDGRAQLFYPDGSLWSQAAWENGILESLPILYSEKQPVPAQPDLKDDGAPPEKRLENFKTFYSGGTQSGEWSALGGKLHGTSKRFSPSGSLLSEISFDSGAPEGAWKLYDFSGRLRQKIFFSNGEREGPHRLYYPDGSLLAEIPYKRGSISDEPRFYSEGRVRPARPQDL